MKKAIFLILFAIVVVNLVNLSLVLGIKQKTNSPVPTVIPTPKPTPTIVTSKPIVLAFVGDLSLAREINYQIQQRGIDYPFEFVKQIISQANLATANLESPLVDDCPTVRDGMKFCGPKSNVDGLVSAGFDLVNIANNHIGNYGPEGIDQTIEVLKEKEVQPFGLGTIAYRSVDGFTVAFLGFDDTTGPVPDEYLKSKLNEAKSSADYLVVNFHWGQEYQDQPTQRQEYLARLAIDSEADLIVGHHPHVLQPIEYYQDKLIIYSLGNFVFDQMWSPATRTGAIGLVTINPDSKDELELIPVLIENYCQPRPIEGESKENLVQSLMP
ncbi:MAG: CapA family protein [Patescibacteria group bacterium]